MSAVRIGLIGAGLLLLSTAAFAFQEQVGGTTAPAAAPAESSAKPATALGQPDAATGNSAAGTEVRIPGLGKLGNLPKMDFGLELLYGATDQKLNDPQQQQREDAREDLTIRGSVKHKF